MLTAAVEWLCGDGGISVKTKGELASFVRASDRWRCLSSLPSTADFSGLDELNELFFSLDGATCNNNSRCNCFVLELTARHSVKVHSHWMRSHAAPYGATRFRPIPQCNATHTPTHPVLMRRRAVPRGARNAAHRIRCERTFKLCKGCRNRCTD